MGAHRARFGHDRDAERAQPTDELTGAAADHRFPNSCAAREMVRDTIPSLPDALSYWIANVVSTADLHRKGFGTHQLSGGGLIAVGDQTITTTWTKPT